MEINKIFLGKSMAMWRAIHVWELLALGGEESGSQRVELAGVTRLPHQALHFSQEKAVVQVVTDVRSLLWINSVL